MARIRLPNRRAAWTFPVEYLDSGNPRRLTVTIGRFQDIGQPAEVFVDGHKSGTALRHIAADAAVLVSVALQHGISLDELDHSLSRDEQGRPASLLAAIVEAMLRGQHQQQAA